MITFQAALRTREEARACQGVLVGAAVAGGQARGAEVVGVAQPVLEQLRVAGYRAAGAASGHTATRSRSPSRAGPLRDGPPDGVEQLPKWTFKQTVF